MSSLFDPDIFDPSIFDTGQEGFTLDAKTVQVDSFDEYVDVVGGKIDKWKSGEYKQEIKVYGIVREWELNCHEQDVAWNDSVVKHFLTLSKADSSVAFVSTVSLRPISTLVRILAVELEPRRASITLRFYRLTLQETG